MFCAATRLSIDHTTRGGRRACIPSIFSCPRAIPWYCPGVTGYAFCDTFTAAHRCFALNRIFYCIQRLLWIERDCIWPLLLCMLLPCPSPVRLQTVQATTRLAFHPRSRRARTAHCYDLAWPVDTLAYSVASVLWILASGSLLPLRDIT